MREVSEVQKAINEVRDTVKAPSPLSELGSDRDALYDQYDSLNAPPKEEPKEEPKAEPKEEPKAEPEAEKAEFVPEEKPKDEEKTVPYGALKEEREKRKELSRRIKELEDSFKQAVDDNKKLMELMSDKSDEPITDYEKEMLSLRKQLKVALTEIDSMKRGVEKERQVSAEAQLQAQVDKAEAELSKDGFDGFSDFVPQVIKAMNDEDIPMEERNPATWKRVYREIVYPKYIGKYKVVQKESKKAEKEELKKDASLVKSPGKPEAKKKEAEDDTPESYAKWRQSQSFFREPI